MDFSCRKCYHCAFHLRLILVNILLQYGVKIFVITFFKDTYCIEILPNVKMPNGGKLVKLLIWLSTCIFVQLF